MGQKELGCIPRLDLGAPGSATNFLNSGQSVATLGLAAAAADDAMNGTVIYVTVNVQTGFGASAQNTVVFWDTDANGVPDEAIALLDVPLAIVGPESII
jgi:hypothetical protein